MTVNTLGPESSGGPGIGLPVDGHVHFHHRGLVEPTLDAALGNLRRVAGRADGLVGALLLTQARAEHVFEELAALTSIGGWTVTAAAREPQTLIVRRDGAELAIVCGRQVRAEAGLEVLALGTRHEFPGDRPLAATIQAVHDAGALAVLPWGFGKWLGRRGEVVRATLTSVGRERLFIGDNGGRLAGAPPPEIIRRYEQLGFRVLPGTDPFPFGGDFRRVGAFGFLAEVGATRDAPWTRVRECLTKRPVSPRPFGAACRPARFLLNQVGIQIYNRLPRSAPK
jgi:hypothetical protein